MRNVDTAESPTSEIGAQRVWLEKCGLVERVIVHEEERTPPPFS